MSTEAPEPDPVDTVVEDSIEPGMDADEASPPGAQGHEPEAEADETPEPTYVVLDVNADQEAAFDAAADAVAAGQVIVLPTDTVYGVAADPFSPAAVQRLLDAKQRGRDMPPPVLVAEVGMVASLMARHDHRMATLGEAFWPGPLTLVLSAADSLRMDLGDRGATIAVRVPDHEFTRELLRRTGPLAVSSANLNGRDAALTIEDATAQLGNSISVYLDAGEMSGPVPSTILDLSGFEASLLRAGRLTVAEINAVVPGLLPEESEPAEEASDTSAEDADPESAEAGSAEATEAGSAGASEMESGEANP